MKKENSLSHIIQSFKVRDVVKRQLEPNGMKFVSHDQDVFNVCEVLQTSKVTSLPVFDGEECIGVVSFWNIIACLMELEWTTASSLRDDGQDVWSTFGRSTAKDIAECDYNDWRINVDASVEDSLKQIAERPIRRVLVEDDEGKVVAVLATSELIKFIIKHTPHGGYSDSIFTTPVSQLEVGSAPVKSVLKDDPMVTALRVMYDDRHTLTAVVDTSGELVGSISSSDVTDIILLRQYSHLNQSCWDRIASMRMRSVDEKFPYFGVGNHNTFDVLVKKLLATHVHHLYILDKQSKPERVVSFSDICKALYVRCLK